MADVEAQPCQAAGRDSLFVKSASREVRLGFVRKVYGILAAQLLVTVAIAAPLQRMPTKWLVENAWLTQLSVVGSVVAMLAITCCPSLGRTYPTNYITLFLFTACEAVLVGVVSARYTAGLVFACAAITAVIFLGMTAYAWTTKSDFTGAGPYLLGGLLALVALGLSLPLLAHLGVQLAALSKLYAVAGVMIFTIFIVYDTQLILGEFKGHKHSFCVDEYVFAALNLYLDVINLFLELLRLLGDDP
mmetsp:Transcript_20766/g.64875  ORF Transcript_20766/g.64875 Transcript_20766/m.64875 type:complete len:246 (+) Transcript_20766:69-806(+)